MAQSEKTLRLRVMAEYASSGIWVIGAVKPFRHGMISHASLNLPSQLADAFEAWIDWYYDNVDDDRPLDVGAFNEEGLRLATQLKICVGPDVYVEFIPEDATAGLGAAQEIRLDE